MTDWGQVENSTTFLIKFRPWVQQETLKPNPFQPIFGVYPGLLDFSFRFFLEINFLIQDIKSVVVEHHSRITLFDCSNFIS